MLVANGPRFKTLSMGKEEKTSRILYETQEYTTRFPEGLPKPGKSWNLLFPFPGLESHGV